MKKKLLLLGACSLLLCGCGEKPTLQNGEEALITFKDNQMISVDEYYTKIKDNFGLDVLINMVDKYIYEKEFSSKISEANEYADAYIKQLQSNYGDDENTILQMIYYMTGARYSSVDGYKDQLYLNYLQNEAVMKYVEDNIPEDELKEYYEDNVYPNMTLSHIIVTPETTSDMDDEAIEKAEEEAKQKIEEVIKKLDEAKKDNKDIVETFSELAKEYSKDDATKDKGGDLGEINIGSLNSSYDELIKEAAKLKDGEYSTKVITTSAGYHVILKTKTGEKKSYEEALEEMKENIANTKLSADDARSLIIEAVKHYRDDYELNIIDSDLKSQYGIYMNNLINQDASGN